MARDTIFCWKQIFKCIDYRLIIGLLIKIIVFDDRYSLFLNILDSKRGEL